MPGGWRPCQGSLCCCGGSPGCVAGNQLQPARGSSACSLQHSPSGCTQLGRLCVLNLLVATFLCLVLPSFCFPGTCAQAHQDSRCSTRYFHPFLLSPEPLCPKHPDFARTVALPNQQKQKGKELGLPKGLFSCLEPSLIFRHSPADAQAVPQKSWTGNSVCCTAERRRNTFCHCPRLRGQQKSRDSYLNS